MRKSGVNKGINHFLILVGGGGAVVGSDSLNCCTKNIELALT